MSKFSDEMCERVVKDYGDIQNQKYKIFYYNKKIFIIGAMMFAIALIPLTKSVSAKKIKCSDFRYQTDAQKVFDSNPKEFKMLDRDHNGKACQDLP